jgi:hypothetical protein
MSSYDKAMQWLRDHEPQCAAKLEGKQGILQDFLGYRDFSYHCKQVFSPDRWALVGEAGAFLDPFYSPGSDYIAIGNTFTLDLIARDLRGEGIAHQAAFYQQIYFSFFDNHLTLYENQMPLFGDAKVMALKIIWDFAYYWVVPAAFFFHKKLTNWLLFARNKAGLDRSNALNRAMQRLFRDWHRVGVAVDPAFIDIPGIPFMHELNRSLQDELDDEHFVERLQADLALLERLAGEMAAEARRDSPAIDLTDVGEPPAGPATLLAGVLPLLQRAAAKGTDAI